MTGFDIAGLRNVDLVVPDLGAAIAFYTQVWGLTQVERTGRRAWLGGTGEDSHVLVLHQGQRPAIRSVTLRARGADRLDRLRTRLSATYRVSTIAGCDEGPGGGTGFGVVDGAGRTTILVTGDTLRTPDPAVADRCVRLAHVNVNSDDVDRDTAFYTEGLGFGLTDRSRTMAFVRTNDDHHSIVIAQGPVNTLNHVAFLLPTLEGVMRASGRMVDHGFPIGWGVGRHGPGDNVFAYFVDPDGFVIEHTAEVLQVDDGYRVGGPDDWVWPAGRTDQWGIAPPKTLACKAAQLAIPFEPAP